ncbi:hypothetical protein G6011_06594 [Alternaria panax]|uniref:Uncharacterized protein n=1 Tax=Alternaria panax TaxID=48097 RepID=A0AAD4FHH9_9PLEO|nr:hypothetical protein G6011_06594 [Alternaria panax]
MNTFLTAPITIREQIYHELLTYIPPATNVQVTNPSNTATAEVASSSPICKLFTLNRQLNAEVLQFLSSQLCVVVKTNHPRFITSLFDERVQRLPLISQLQSRSGATRKDSSRFPVAMEWDIYVYGNDLQAESASCYLIPATSLVPLIQNARKRMFWGMDTSLTFTLLETFSYSKERALEILIYPWLDRPPLRHGYLSIKTNDAIPSRLTADLRRQLQRTYPAKYYLSKLEHSNRYLDNDNPEKAVKEYTTALKYAHMVYDCHFDCILDVAGDIYGASTDDTVLTLWTLTCRIAVRLIRVFCHLAGTFGPKRLELADASSNVTLLQKARKVAEETISLLSSKPVCAREESLALGEVQTPVRWDKFLLSFRTHVVCKALDDIDAAIGYLEDAIKYDFENTEKPVEKLNKLRAERGAGNEGLIPRVVRWES